MPRTDQTSTTRRSALYRLIWRWHFYAGLFVVPMVIILSLSGALYLFKPQIERFEERAWRGLPIAASVSPDMQQEAARLAYPGARFLAYRLPEEPGDAAMISLALPGTEREKRDVFVSPQGKVLGSLNPDTRIMEIVQSIHGQLLIGKAGSILVELAASWAIVMILTGLYLWWPSGRRAAGVVWPRVTQGKRTALRDLHAVTGFWVSGLALVLLLTGLPWAEVWGSAFKAVRAELGWVKGAQDWTIGGKAPSQAASANLEHHDHDHDAMMAAQDAQNGQTGIASTAPLAPARLGQMVARAQAEQLAFPVIITPPGAPGRFGRAGDDGWTIRSDTQNRPLRLTIRYDAAGQERGRERFADSHLIDRIIGYGVAWHEGQLFGWVNQLIGVLTALMLVTLSISGFLLWRKRKPAHSLGAPPAAYEVRKARLVPIIILLAALLPLLAGSLLVLAIIDRWLLPRSPRLARWMGMA